MGRVCSRVVPVVAAVAALAVGACGGDEDTAGGVGGAESTVRDYLRALVDQKGADACAKFSPEYQRSVLRQNRQFAQRQKVDDCAGLLDAITRASGAPTFEGQPLTRENAGKVELKTKVRLSGQEQNATVTGARGVQRYELETRDGRWYITKIERIG